MKYYSSRTLAIFSLSIMALSSMRSHADISINAREIGSDVTLSYFGSIDLTGLGVSQPTSSRAAVYPVNAYIEFGPITAIPVSNSLYLNSIVTADSVASIGAGGYGLATSVSGTYFSVNNNSIKLPLDYASGTEIFGSMTFEGKSLADLQITKTETPSVWVLTNGQKITLSFLGEEADSGPIGVNGEKKLAIEKDIKKLRKEIRIAKSKGQKSRINKLKKKLTLLNSKLDKL
jgi:aspartate 1-decarboxylase